MSDMARNPRDPAFTQNKQGFLSKNDKEGYYRFAKLYMNDH